MRPLPLTSLFLLMSALAVTALLVGCGSTAPPKVAMPQPQRSVESQSAPANGDPAIPLCSLSYSTLPAPGFPQGINNVGIIVGDNPLDGSAFILARGKVTTYSVPGATSTEFRDINDAGSIIGQYSSASSTHGFVIAHDTFTSFDYPGATDRFPLGINDRGDIAGQAQVNNVSVGFIRHADGQFETFAPSPYIRRMNNPEHLVGLDLLTGASFLFRNGTLTLFNVPGAPSTSAVGMNDPDEIVGVYSVGGAEHSFLKSGSSYCEVKVPNSSETLANDINNAGEIVGVFSGVTAEGGGFHGFVARPAHP